MTAGRQSSDPERGTTSLALSFRGLAFAIVPVLGALAFCAVLCSDAAMLRTVAVPSMAARGRVERLATRELW